MLNAWLLLLPIIHLNVFLKSQNNFPNLPTTHTIYRNTLHTLKSNILITLHECLTRQINSMIFQLFFFPLSFVFGTPRRQNKSKTHYKCAVVSWMEPFYLNNLEGFCGIVLHIICCAQIRLKWYTVKDVLMHRLFRKYF